MTDQDLQRAIKQMVQLAKLNHKDMLRCRKKWEYTLANWYAGRRDGYLLSARILQPKKAKRSPRIAVAA